VSPITALDTTTTQIRSAAARNDRQARVINLDATPQPTSIHAITRFG
jgi:hypothetical protein